MAIDLARFDGEPPFDAQYVGTFQPLFGWIGRLGKLRAQAEVEALVDEVVADLTPPATGLIPGFGTPQVAVHRSVWAGRLLDLAGLRGEQPLSPGGEAGAPDLMSRVGASMRRLFDRDPAVERSGSEAEPSAGASRAAAATRTRTSGAYRETLELLRREPGFRAAFEGSLRDADRALADLVGFVNELDLDRPGARLLLSPIGLLDLYREYYFDLGTRLGPPIEHVWIAPGSELEVVESYSRTEYSFVETELAVSQASETTETVTEAETFSEEVERTQQRDLAVGVAAEGGVNFPVWHVSANASFDYASSLALSKRQAAERSREVSSKASREMKRSSRLLTRRSTEETRTSSRTHRITNPSAEVRHLEMRRKYLHIGVQVQHVGTALCWQMYVPRPGARLELPALVHVGASEDFLNETPPDGQVEAPAAEVVSEQLTIPLQPVRTRTNTDQSVDTNNRYYRYTANRYPVGNVNLWVATDDSDEAPDDSDDVLAAEFKFQSQPPTPGFRLKSVRLGAIRGTDPSKDAPSLFAAHTTIEDEAVGRFTVVVDAVNFEQNPAIEVTAELLFEPPPQSATPAADPEAHAAGMKRKAREAIVKAVRDRVRLASTIRPRHGEDMRSEERSVVYQALLERLVGRASGGTLHLLSEVIQTLFDIERMLYYVAPDWWDPRRNRSTLNLPTVQAAGEVVTLSPLDRARFGEDGDGRATYLVTEESEPAPLGRSLGWLAALDGDDKRNMFLNSPWVKAVLPIRPGREREAIEFLRQAHIEGPDGLDANEIGQDGMPTGRTVREALLALAAGVRQANHPDRVYGARQQVFENGFRPLDGRLRLDGQPLEVFAQWVEVVPTRQVVPVPYALPAAFRPVADDGGGGDGDGGGG